MPSLPDELFSLLENKTLQAREAAEKAARNILAYLKVENGTWWGKKEDLQRDLWLGLRARARQVGYSVEENSEKDPVKRGLPQLVEEIAYEQWHRMLFARFLAENNLLIHSTGVPVSLAECEELTTEEGEDDAWRLAARYAGAMLPGIFKKEDPCAQVRLTPSDHHALESILLEIPPLVFTCDDALGWMYQFWQSKKKKEVNDSERKIGGADISPVTQLFTEDYMVRFLLENSLGAWWAARHPGSPLIKEWEYLRFKDDGTPAAGSFLGWPERAAEVTVMDPCCGSGHFLVAAFEMLRRMRMEEEGLDAATAARRTLQDNIFGLEIDQRCTQIAWFALSLMGWKNGGYQPLSELNIACTGIPVKGQLDSWLALAGEDSRVKAGLERLYNLFKDAPDLGSLINPENIALVDRMFVADYEQVSPLFEKIIIAQQQNKEERSELLGYETRDLAKIARFLSRKYFLVITNVPYLGKSKQSSILTEFCGNLYPMSNADLATIFIERCLEYCEKEGTISIVTPHNWKFLKSYRKLRKKLLSSKTWNLSINLGFKAFKTPLYDFNTGLSIITNTPPNKAHEAGGFDLSDTKFSTKQSLLLNSEIQYSNQIQMITNHLSIITFAKQNDDSLLANYANVYYGSKPGQTTRVTKFFWEIAPLNENYWMLMESSPNQHNDFSGKREISYTLKTIKEKNITEFGIRGKEAWGKNGVIISRMANLPSSLYLGNFFDDNTYVILPKRHEDLLAIYSFIKSTEFRKAVRERNQKLGVDTGAMIFIPFDLSFWEKKADLEFPNGLPKPYSTDPTQWLFSGKIITSTEPLQVSLLRLIDYKWPKQSIDQISDLVDEDGIVCLSTINGEPPAAERLRALLAAAYGDEWSGAKQEELLAAMGYSGKDLADWLRDGFFEQHCKLFQNRPFIWHIWDGRKDGFSALVNYHKLDRANLEKLTYTYLGAWIIDRKKEMDRGVAGAEGRLLAAQALQDKLKLILAGEPPYDIYVRWKPLHEQPMGWEPDLNDGVRLNIRPFVTAGVLRSKFTINWNKDRGKNPDGSERLNDLHFTIAEKRTAREKQRK